MYTGNPLTNAIDRVRLAVGDTDCDYEWLDDQTYSYYLTKNNNSEGRAALDCAKAILFSLARRTRERAGEIEVYGDQMFSNYEKALKLILKDPFLTGINVFPYAGGISRSDMQANDQKIDSPAAVLFRGMTWGSPAYLTKTVYSSYPTTEGF